MKVLLSDIARLATFQHDGSGLNWSKSQAKQLAVTVFALPVIASLASNGISNTVSMLAGGWLLILATLAMLALLLIHFGRAFVVYAEVGILLLCFLFYVIYIAFALSGAALSGALLYALIGWFVSSTFWYVNASHAKKATKNNANTCAIK